MSGNLYTSRNGKLILRIHESDLKKIKQYVHSESKTRFAKLTQTRLVLDALNEYFVARKIPINLEVSTYVRRTKKEMMEGKMMQGITTVRRPA